MKKDIQNNPTLEKIVSLAKRRGFVFQGSEIYGGLAGTWDYGPLGIALKRNIEALWWKRFVEEREDVYGVDSAIMMNSKVWEAAGHVEGFHDPLVEDVKTHKRYRAETLLEKAGVSTIGMDMETMAQMIEEKGIKSPDGNQLLPPQQFNMMFETSIGSAGGEHSKVYLRPETAQGMFVNFKNIIDSFHPKLPFGVAQIGKAFRNEINARDFLFRAREFEQMEVEYFVRESEWEKWFEHWKDQVLEWIHDIGLSRDKVHEVEVPKEGRAHYSARTLDFEYDFPFGRKELYGLAYRTDFDLTSHKRESGVDLSYHDPKSGERFVPHVIEPTFGMGRTILAILCDAYKEDDLGDGRVYLALAPSIAPIKIAVFPLLKNKPELVTKAREVYEMVRKEVLQTMWDDNGNIGKRYRRQDEIGTPLCVTIDFDTLEDNTVTLRDRDTGEQRRVKIDDLKGEILK